MYKIEITDYGIKLIFGGIINQDEMSEWVTESEKVLETISVPFNVFVDMRELKPLSFESQKEMEKGQNLYKSKGMEKSVVILNNDIVTMQFKRIAQKTEIYRWERYIDASKHSNWEEMGLKWLIHLVDPDEY